MRGTSVAGWGRFLNWNVDIRVFCQTADDESLVKRSSLSLSLFISIEA